MEFTSSSEISDNLFKLHLCWTCVLKYLKIILSFDILPLKTVVIMKEKKRLSEKTMSWKLLPGFIWLYYQHLWAVWMLLTKRKQKLVRSLILLFQRENYIFEDKEFFEIPSSVSRALKYSSFTIFDMLSYLLCSCSCFYFCIHFTLLMYQKQPLKT